ncbi:hypothetical protein OS175_03920 [Marinicella sp. S1101]|nr:hypothetical protein [Marinicella marina]MCX7553014.1 hypothetical protein [Marinicella marina]
MKLKMVLIMLIFSGCLRANDLVFKSGFENSFLIGGQVVGLTSDALVLELFSDSGYEEITLSAAGAFYFECAVNVGAAWRVVLKNLPDQPQQQTCFLTNHSGNSLPVGGVDDVNIICQNEAWDWDVMNWGQGGWN